MRILIATDAWHPQVNGVVRTLTTVVAELRAMGHVVEVISPNRFRTIAGAAAAARGAGSVDAAKRHYQALTALAADSDGARPELAEAKTYLSQN